MWVNSHGVFKLFLALVLVLSSTGCEDTNMLETFSNKEDDASLYAAALHHLNKGRYDDAIAVCESMSISQRHGQARFVCASSYAGRCGYSMP